MHDCFRTDGHWEAFKRLRADATELAEMLQRKRHDTQTVQAIEYVTQEGYLDMPDHHGVRRKQWLGPGVHRVGRPRNDEEAQGKVRVVLCGADETESFWEQHPWLSRDAVQMQPGMYCEDEQMIALLWMDDKRWFSREERGSTFIHQAHRALPNGGSDVDGWHARLAIAEEIGGRDWRDAVNDECEILRRQIGRKNEDPTDGMFRQSGIYHDGLDCMFGCQAQDRYVMACRRSLASMAANLILAEEAGMNRYTALELLAASVNPNSCLVLV